MPAGVLEKKAKEKWKNSLVEEQLGGRFFLGLLIFFVLALFFHFRDIHVDFVEVSGKSKGFVVAQVDFQFPDQEATLVLRQEAMKDIGTIYRLNPNQVKDIRKHFDDYLVNHRSWRNKVSRSGFDQMYNIADVVEDQLTSIRISDSRTYEKIRFSQVPLEDYFEWDEKESSYAVSPRIWKDIESRIVNKYHFDRDAVHYVIDYFEATPWKLEPDTEAQRFFRQVIEASIPEKYTKVRSGTKLVDKGEEVTKLHRQTIQAMKKQLFAERNLFGVQHILSSLLFSFVVTIIGAIYLYYNHRYLLISTRKLSLYITIIVMTLIISKATEFFFMDSTKPIIQFVKFPLLVPFSAILICVLLDKNIALFSTFILTVILGITLAVDHSRFLFVNLVAGMATILFSKTLRKRKEVFIVCALAWLSSIPVIIAFKLGENQLFDFSLVQDLISALICMSITALLIVVLLPLIEMGFQVMTDMTLMEFMDPNNDLLRRLSLEAPGTYQHSLVVGSLSEAAAQSIGANGLFCRVSTLYHDIGKLFNPHYFTENQMGGFDIHQLLTPLESAQVIIAHVAEGEALAKKHGLPKPFIDIIKEHHGTTLAYFFYAKQVEQAGGDPDLVNQKQFTYPGPKPRTKESAIIMIADSVEAASRSMDDPTEETIRELVDRLVAEKAEEGQFDNCQLTFEELGIVKKTMVKTLSVTRHLRIKYPKKIKH